MPTPINVNVRPLRFGNGQPLPALPPELGAGADPAAKAAQAETLLQLVTVNKVAILGGNKKINNDEGAFLLNIGKHGSANDAVKQGIKNLVAASRSAPAALKEWVAALRPAVDVNPELPPVAPGGGGSTSGVDSNGPVILRPEVNGINPLYFDGPTHFDGDFRLNPASLADPNIFGTLPSADKFGKVAVPLPTGGVREVGDNIFNLGNGKVGVRVLPAADVANGSKVIDAYIRKAMGIGPEPEVRTPENYHKARIYASVLYWHPELYAAKGMADLAKNMLATEGRATHEGSYLGNGETTNAPEGYHRKQWGLTDGTTYPAHVFMESLKGVDQETYNWQGYAIDKVLNLGVQFPNDYKKDIYRARDVNTALMFFRDWVLSEPYLKEDNTWATYCAEHKNIVRILRMNLPLNEASFKDAFGEADGAKVWENWSKDGGVFQQAHGVAWRKEYETNFKPVWARDGFKPEEIRPFKDLAEYDRHEIARDTGPEALAAYKAAGGQIPLGERQAMPYATESTSDLIRDFVETYASFGQVGGVASSATIMSFRDVCIDRLCLDEDAQGNRNADHGNKVFMAHALPVIQEILYHEALVQKSEGQVPLTIWLKGAEAGMLKALAGENEAALQDPVLKATVKAMFEKADAEKGAIDAGRGLPRAEAHRALKAAIADEAEAARNIGVLSPTAIERNAPPGLLMRVIQRPDHHPPHKDLTIKYLCTAVEARDVVPA
ncbi:MAG: hypothetical protein IPG45_30050 [Deltaproteobacteria bacterium]|nr:hypothetical protein [Deltaproteobacteria bacterium]